MISGAVGHMAGVGIVQYWGGCPQTPNSKWTRFLHVMRRCAEEGWRTHLVWSRMPDDPALSRPFLDFGCEIILQPRAHGNFDPACVWRTYKLLRRIECDVLHCHNVHTSPLIAAALARVPVRIWSKLAMSPCYERQDRPRRLHRLHLSDRLSVALAHRTLCISQAVAEELRQVTGRPDRLLVHPAPVDVDLYSNASGDGVRAELGVSESEIVIATVGRAAPVKGWDILIRAFGKLAEAVPEARLLLVGSTQTSGEADFADQLRDLVNLLALDGRVRFLGQRANIPQILAASDVFAFPSRSEGQGLALTEAMALGLPCVASKAGGIVDLVEDGKNGLLVDREDVDGLAEALVRLIQSEELRARLGKSAQQSARRFGLETAVTSLVCLYQNLLVEHGRLVVPSSPPQVPTEETSCPDR